MHKPNPVRGLRHWREGVSFIKTELDVGLAFSAIALQATDWKKAARNTAHARAAFDMAQRYVKRVLLTPEDSREINQGFRELRARLEHLSAFPGSVAAVPTQPDPKL